MLLGLWPRTAPLTPHDLNMFKFMKSGGEGTFFNTFFTISFSCCNDQDGSLWNVHGRSQFTYLLFLLESWQ